MGGAFAHQTDLTYPTHQTYPGLQSRLLAMIKSMTGFAALTREDERATISVTIRAVNHRHLDLQLRNPQSLAAITRARASGTAQRASRAGR